MANKIGLIAAMLVIPVITFIGAQLQNPGKETKAEEDAKWISEVVNPTMELWRTETIRCELNWQINNLPEGKTGVVTMPKVPSNIHKTCMQLAADSYPLKQR